MSLMKAEALYQNPWFKVIRRGVWHWVEPSSNPNGAAVLPIVGDKILLLKRNRVSQCVRTLEIPRGAADPGETALDCAVRELREETGLQATADMMTPLGAVRPDTGVFRSRVSLFLAQVPEDTPWLDPDDESEGVVMIPVAEMGRFVRDGHIEDGFTLSALALHFAKSTAKASEDQIQPGLHFDLDLS